MQNWAETLSNNKQGLSEKPTSDTPTGTKSSSQDVKDDNNRIKADQDYILSGLVVDAPREYSHSQEPEEYHQKLMEKWGSSIHRDTSHIDQELMDRQNKSLEERKGTIINEEIEKAKRLENRNKWDSTSTITEVRKQLDEFSLASLESDGVFDDTGSHNS